MGLRCGAREDIAGHITWEREPGKLLINPWGLWWDEVKGSDVCTVDYDGNVIEGKWDVTPAFHIHTELHKRRPSARVVVHNHPYHVVVLAALGVFPEIMHQQGSMFADDLVLIDEYTGEIDDAELGGELAERIGDAQERASWSATGSSSRRRPTAEEAVYRSASIDRMCRLAYDVLVSGRSHHPLGKRTRRGHEEVAARARHRGLLERRGADAAARSP